MRVFVFIYIHIHTRLSLSLSLSLLSLCRSLVYMCSNVVYFPLEVWKWKDRLASVATRRSLRARRDILDDGSKCKVAEDLSFKFSKLEEVLSRALRSLVNIEKFVEVDFRLLLIQKEQKQWVSEP